MSWRVTVLLAVVGLIEIVVFLLAGFVVFRRRGYRFSEALSAAIVFTLAALSFTFQAAFLLGVPRLSFIAEFFLLGLSAAALVRYRGCLGRGWHTIRSFAAEKPLVTAAIGVAWSYLALLALVIPNGNPDNLRYHFSRVLLFQQESTFFLEVPADHQSPLAVFPVGSDVLAHAFLRFSTDYGLGIFGFLSYMAIAMGCHALARRYAAFHVALAPTLVIASLPVVVYLSTSGKNDIVMGATGVLCLVLARRLGERPNAGDVLLLALALSFGVSTKVLFLGFAVPFLLFIGSYLALKHWFQGWRRAGFRWWMLAAVIPIAVFSQVWLFVHNHEKYGGWSGPPELTRDVRNNDGATGAVANAVRYAFEAADPLKVVDMIVKKVAGTSISQYLQKIYDRVFRPLWGEAGIGSGFRVNTAINESESWYGPLGALLVLPSLVYGLWRGPVFVRALVLVLASYFGAVCWQIDWTMWHGRYFVIVFAGASPCLALLLARWERRPWRLALVVSLSIACLYYGCVFNEVKPLLPLTYRGDLFYEQLVRRNVWTATRGGTDRYHYYGNRAALESFAASVGHGERVSVVLRDNAYLYFYLRRRPDAIFRIVPKGILEDGWVSRQEAGDSSWLLCIGLEGCRSLRAEGGVASRLCAEVDGRFNDFCLYRFAAGKPERPMA